MIIYLACLEVRMELENSQHILEVTITVASLQSHDLNLGTWQPGLRYTMFVASVVM